MTVWIFSEAGDGGASASSLELLTKARELGEVHVFHVGAEDGDLFAELGDHGAAVVHYLDPGDRLPAPVAAAALGELAPAADLVLFGSGSTDRDVAGRLSARIGRPVVAGALDVIREDEGLAVVTEILGGAVRVITGITAPAPAIVVIRPKAFAAEGGTGGVPESHPVAVPDIGRSGFAAITGRHAETSAGPDLEAADIVVSGGRGIGGAEQWPVVEQLAGLLGGAVGATRAVVDAGWVPYSYQVGQTGKTVKPSVYLAAGISGAMQHLVGMKDSTTIIAINKDPDAPIFGIADLGVIGDVHQVLPRLIAALEARTG